ncbi:MAG TPA: hypothetical protein VH475_26890 [Tepidisphaeraceae bacterium]|jgi:hypothetical protein
MSGLRQYAASFTVGLAALVVAGCADRPVEVPSTASLMTEGNGSKLTFAPTHFGRVYVTDDTNHKILYQGDVERGDNVEVNAVDDRILVGGKTVTQTAIDDGHQLKVFFEPLDQTRTVRYRVVDEPVR